MFAPSYFAAKYFAPSYFPPGAQLAVERAKPPAGVRKKKYWKFEEGLPYPIIIEEILNSEDRIILQSYLDQLRSQKVLDSVVGKSTRLVVLRKDSKGRSIIESNNNVLFLMAALDFI